MIWKQTLVIFLEKQISRFSQSMRYTQKEFIENSFLVGSMYGASMVRGTILRLYKMCIELCQTLPIKISSITLKIRM